MIFWGTKCGSNIDNGTAFSDIIYTSNKNVSLKNNKKTTTIFYDWSIKKGNTTIKELRKKDQQSTPFLHTLYQLTLKSI